VSNLGKLLSGGAPLLAGIIIRSVASSGSSPRFGWVLGLSAPALCYAVLAALVWTLPSVDGRSLAALERDEYLETPRRSTGR
jgi:hypothetical protein